MVRGELAQGAKLSTPKRAAGTGGSVVVERCQVCESAALEPIVFLGYLPPVNAMQEIGSRPAQQPAYPAQLLSCRSCGLVQLGLIIDPAILFPPTYPYTSGTTRILRENFAELFREHLSLFPLDRRDLVVDIGSNDGTLLGNFGQAGYRVLGIEPTNAAALAEAHGVPTLRAFFSPEVVRQVVARHGRARLVTATNVFAHMEDIHGVTEALLDLLDEDGVFVSESHYWLSLLETLQYDTIYHEHLRHYSVTSLSHLLRMHGLDVLHVRRIPPHGGSIRVYAARPGKYQVWGSVASMLALEERELTPAKLAAFRAEVVESKLALHHLIYDLKREGARIFGIGAPSRASTLINYVGLDDGILDCVVEVPGSQKIGKYIPGTLIPVREESLLFDERPEYALLLSWHIADELMPKLKAKGYPGEFVVPLPKPRVVPAPLV